MPMTAYKTVIIIIKLIIAELSLLQYNTVLHTIQTLLIGDEITFRKSSKACCCWFKRMPCLLIESSGRLFPYPSFLDPYPLCRSVFFFCFVLVKTSTRNSLSGTWRMMRKNIMSLQTPTKTHSDNLPKPNLARSFQAKYVD